MITLLLPKKYLPEFPFWSVLYWTIGVGMDLHFLVATKAFCAISGLLTAAANISFRFYTLSLHNLSGLLFIPPASIFAIFCSFYYIFSTLLYYISFCFAGVYEHIRNRASLSDTYPYFDATSERNVTSFVGQVTHLHCTVRDIGDRTVRTVFNRFLMMSTDQADSRCFYFRIS